jgi:hypothetical protein
VAAARKHEPQREPRAWWLAAGTLLVALVGLCFFPR